MGADGGFSYTKIQDFRDNWKEIKASLLEGCLPKSWNYDYQINEMCEIKISVEKMPDNLENMSNSDIIEMLKPFESCDCPGIIEDYLLITWNGDDVANNMIILDDALWRYSTSIETWT